MTPDIFDRWSGVLDTGADKATLSFALGADPAVARLQTRAAAEFARPLDLSGGRIRFAAPAFDIALDLAFDAAPDRLAGVFRNSGARFPIAFTRGPPLREPRAPRPQTPTPPFPYESRNVALPGAGGVSLAGTLTLPAGSPPHPAVVLSTWHGRADRNQTARGHQPFALWADRLTRAGLATLRYDKRGVGESSGDFERATTDDFAADLAHALAFLREQPEVDPARTGLMGHSEGGHVSADVAAADPRAAFCVLLTPSGVAEEATFATELFRAARAVGGTPEHETQSIALLIELADAARTAVDGAEAAARSRAVLARAAAAGLFPAEAIERRAALSASPWRRRWLTYDHTAALRRLACPVLVVFAARDLQTAPRRHAPPVRAALAAHPRATLIELAGLNHGLQGALTGAPSEYGDIAQTLAPEAIAAVCDWVRAVV